LLQVRVVMGFQTASPERQLSTQAAAVAVLTLAAVVLQTLRVLEAWVAVVTAAA
jgi:hypothetical protein